MFLLTVTFGLFHGLVFLPVVLIMVGGASTKTGSASSSSSSSSTSEESVGSEFSGRKNEAYVKDEVSVVITRMP